MIPTNGDSRFFDQLVEGGRAEIPEDFLLYEVYGRDSDLPEDEWEKIGSIYTKSFFTQSLWGDERLFFEHEKLGNDLDFISESFKKDK